MKAQNLAYCKKASTFRRKNYNGADQMRRLVTHQLFSCSKVKVSYGIWMEGGWSSNRLVSSMKNRCFHVFFCLFQTDAIEGACRNKLYTRVDKCPENDTRLRDFKKTSFRLNSTEHDTFTAHKNKILKTNGILSSKLLDVFMLSCS